MQTIAMHLLLITQGPVAAETGAATECDTSRAVGTQALLHVPCELQHLRCMLQVAGCRCFVHVACRRLHVVNKL
jgi:hypothetical protein